jgi:hypothetical protein
LQFRNITDVQSVHGLINMFLKGLLSIDAAEKALGVSL